MRYITALAVAVAVFMGIGTPDPQATAVIPGGFELDPQLARWLWSIGLGLVTAWASKTDSPLGKILLKVVDFIKAKFSDKIDLDVSIQTEQLASEILKLWMAANKRGDVETAKALQAALVAQMASQKPTVEA